MDTERKQFEDEVRKRLDALEKAVGAQQTPAVEKPTKPAR